MIKTDENITTLLIKADTINQKEIESIKPKLLAEFTKLFSEFLDNFKDLNSILNRSQDKNLIYYFEEINKSLAVLVREAESLSTDKTKSNNYMNLERSIKRQLNFLSKISYSNFENKPLLIAIDNNSIKLYALTRFLHDIFNIEKSFIKQSVEESTTTVEKELHRISSEFQNRYPRYNFIKIELKDYSDELDLKFVTPAQSELKRKLRETIAEIRTRFERYLSWELRKIGQSIKCFIITSNTSISVAYAFEVDESEKPEVCEKCEKKTTDISHFNKFGIDEYVCNDCYIDYLLSEEY